MTTVLLVCTANICRSPVAEALLRHHLDRAGMRDVVVFSGGFLADGWPAAEFSRAVLDERYGLDLSNHRSRRLGASDVHRSDLVLCMESRHVVGLDSWAPEAQPPRLRLAELVGEARDVTDPHGGPRHGYEAMVTDVDDLLRRGLPEILRWLGHGST